jgi:hypothetical protein
MTSIDGKSTKDILDNLVATGFGGLESTVFLNFAAFDERSGSEEAGITNRIMLKCETIGITTNRQVAPIPIPFSGAVTGESQTLAIDLGIAGKNIELGGIITDQVIKKKLTNVDTEVVVHMTAFEIAQMMHSAVDSSFLQKHQNISELVILMPSRVNRLYRYHRNVSATTPHDELPLIPFSYKARSVLTNTGQRLIDQGSDWDETFVAASNADTEIKKGDNHFAALTGDFPDPGDRVFQGISGFVSNFGTQITPGQPFITFNLSFVVASVIGQ